MIKESIVKETITVCKFYNRHGKTTEALEDATIIVCVSDDGLTIPFVKERLGNDVVIGDSFVQITKIAQDGY